MWPTKRKKNLMNLCERISWCSHNERILNESRIYYGCFYAFLKSTTGCVHLKLHLLISFSKWAVSLISVREKLLFAAEYFFGQWPMVGCVVNTSQVLANVAPNQLRVVCFDTCLQWHQLLSGQIYSPKDDFKSLKFVK